MRRLASALLLLTLTACGAATPATDGDSTGAASPAAQSPAASAAPSMAAQPSTAAQPAETSTSIGTIGGNAGAADEVERQAQATLARQLNVAPETLVLQNKEEMEWSDGSLGCAVPDMMYAQVITPGYKLTYSDGGQSYELHTNQSGSQVVLCANGKPREIAQP